MSDLKLILRAGRPLPSRNDERLSTSVKRDFTSSTEWNSAIRIANADHQFGRFGEIAERNVLLVVVGAGEITRCLHIAGEILTNDATEVTVGVHQTCGVIPNGEPGQHFSALFITTGDIGQWSRVVAEHCEAVLWLISAPNDVTTR